jgi:hypothetical protein
MAPSPPGNPVFPQQSYYQQPIAPISYPAPSVVPQRVVPEPTATVEQHEPAKEELPAPQEVRKTPPHSPQVKPPSPKPTEPVADIEAPAEEQVELPEEDQEDQEDQSSEDQNEEPPAAGESSEPHDERAKDSAPGEGHSNEGGAVDDTWSAMVNDQ